MLTKKQLLAINLLVMEGLNQRETAKELGLSPITITRWFKLDEFVDEYNKTIRHKISVLSSKAINRIVKLIDSPNPTVALNASKDIASRAGLDAAIKQEINMEATLITVDYGYGDDNK